MKDLQLLALQQCIKDAHSKYNDYKRNKYNPRYAAMNIFNCQLPPKQAICLYGLFLYVRENLKFSTDDLIKLVEAHPVQLYTFKTILKYSGTDNLVEELSEHGFIYARNFLISRQSQEKMIKDHHKTVLP